MILIQQLYLVTNTRKISLNYFPAPQIFEFKGIRQYNISLMQKRRYLIFIHKNTLSITINLSTIYT